MSSPKPKSMASLVGDYKTPPKQLDRSQVRSFSPGCEKFEKLIDFKKWLDDQRKSTLIAGPSRFTLSSSKSRILKLPSSTPPRNKPPLTMISLKPRKGLISPLLPLDSSPAPPGPKESSAPAQSPGHMETAPPPSYTAAEFIN